MRPVLLLILFSIFTAHYLRAQALLRGQVVDAQTREPLPYVRVKLTQASCNKTTETLSDGSGMFTLALHGCPPQATDSVAAFMVGYHTLRFPVIQFNAGDHILRLSPESVNLQTVEITALKKTGAQIVRKAYNRITANYPVSLFAVTSGECNALQQSTWHDNTKRGLFATRFCLTDSGYTTDLRTIKTHMLEYNQDAGYKAGFDKASMQVDTAIGKRYSKLWGIIASMGERMTWPYYEYDPIRQSHQEGPGRMFLRFNQDFVNDAKFGEPSLGRFKIFDADRILVSFTYTPPNPSANPKNTGRSVYYRGNIYIDTESYAIVRFTYEIVFTDSTGQSLVASAQQTDYAPISAKSRKMVLAHYMKTFELRYYNPTDAADYYSVLHQFSVCNINYGKPLKNPPMQPALNPTLPLSVYRCQD
jgi:hypothetical protein